MSYKPQRKFLGSEGDYSVDDRGPEALKTDIDNIMNMFDPTATHPDGTQGGIDYGNLSFDLSDEGMAEHIGGKLDGSALTVQQIIDLLNQMIKNRYTKEESDTLLTSKTNPLIKTLTYHSDTGVMTATTEAGNTVQVFDLNIEKIPADIGIVEEDNKVYIRITNTDGTYTQSDVSELLTQYSFASTKTIQCQIAYMSGNNVDKTVSFILENGAVEMRHLAADVTSTITEAKESATISATSAATSASNAKDSEANAKVSEQNAKASENKASSAATIAEAASDQAILAARNAVQANQSVEELAKQVEENTETAVASANTATIKANAAEEAFKDAKSSADVAAVSEANAKSSKETAAISAKESATQALNAAESASTATIQATLSGELRTETKSYRDETLDAKQQSYDYAIKSKSYAVGDTGVRENEDIDNARYYAEQAKYNASAGGLTCLVQEAKPSINNCIWAKVINEVSE